MKATPALATLQCPLATMEDELPLVEAKQVTQKEKQLLYEQVEELK